MNNMLLELLTKDRIFIDGSFPDKSTFVKFATDHMVQNGICSDANLFCQDVFERESIMSTDLEEGVTLPHAKSKAIKKAVIYATNLAQSWENIHKDGKKIRTCFLLAIPHNAPDEHIKILSQLSVLFLKEGFLDKLAKAKTPESFIQCIQDNLIVEEAIQINQYPEILAVTACPTGIAHTYVVAEKLMQMAQDLGVSIKVETNGSIGVENALTEDEIKNAKTIILAVDKGVETERFVGKHLIEATIAEALHHPKRLIENAKKQDAPIYKNKSSASPFVEKKKSPFYRHLMSGVSAIIPVVVVGGVYIALAIAMSGVEAGTGISITNPILKKMEQVGGLAFGLMIPILAGFIAMSIADRPGLVPGLVGGALAAQLGTGFLGGIVAGFVAGYIVDFLVKNINLPKSLTAVMPIFIAPLVGTALTVVIIFLIGSPIQMFMDSLTDFLRNMQSSSILLGAILGAMIAFDMGGPLNKVAFLFGVSMIQAGIPEIMGMVAVAICVPPLGMWLAVQMNRKNFTDQEREAGNAAFLMGLIGITEGAIPFAVANPFRVIPALVLGSMSASMIAAIMGVTNHAPHGGPIVLPVVGNRIGFLLAVIVGMCITAVLVNLFMMTQPKSESTDL